MKENRHKNLSQSPSKSPSEGPSESPSQDSGENRSQKLRDDLRDDLRGDLGGDLGGPVGDTIAQSQQITVVLRPWDSFFALYVREMKRFMKVIFQTIFAPLINSTLYLLIFGVSLGASITLDHPTSYLAFLIPGLVMMGVLNNAFQNSSSSIVSGKFSGDLEDLKVVPLTPKMILGAMSIAALTRGLIVGAVTFLVGEMFLFIVEGSLTRIEHPLWLMYFLTVGGLSFAGLGVAIAFWAKSFDQMSAVGSFVLLPLIYLGGVFFSIKGLHPFWQTVSSFNPVLYLINGVRYGISGVTDVDVVAAAIVSFIFLSFFSFLALRALKYGSYQRW